MFDQEIESQNQTLRVKELNQQNAAIERDKKMSIQVLSKLIAKFEKKNEDAKKGKGKKGKKGKGKSKKKKK